MQAYPKCEFVIFNGNIYHNNVLVHSGAKNWSVMNVTGGYLSLYEYNIDRQYVDTGRQLFAGTNSAGDAVGVADTGLIYPWIVKTGEGFGYGTVTQWSASNTSASWAYDYDYGDIIAGTYPLSASISREFLTPYAGATSATNHGSYYTTTPTYRHYYSLRNTFEANAWRSKEFFVTSSGPLLNPNYDPLITGAAWIKDQQLSNLISIPSIFYGTRIKPGTVSAKWYYTGSLIGELQDTRQNGVLYEVSGTNVGAPAGVILYEQGEIFLTGAWDLGPSLTKLAMGTLGDPTGVAPSWVYFGAGALDGRNADSMTSLTFLSAGFGLSFSGSTATQVMTMFAHAGRDEANYSNNPTYIRYGQSLLESTSSHIYEENPTRYVFNTVSSSYLGYSAPFKRQTYISRVAIYDKHKNLVGIATLADPVLKEEDQDLTFKLRLDI